MTTSTTKLFVSITVLLFLPFLCCAQTQSKGLPAVIINEINYSGQANDDAFIELVVISENAIPIDGKPSTPKFIIDDTNIIFQGGSSSDLEPGYLSIKPDCLEDLNSGDIVIIHGNDTDVSQAQNAILFNVNDPCVERFENSPTALDKAYNTANPVSNTQSNLTDFISFQGNNDLTQVRIGSSYKSRVFLSDGATNYSLTTTDIHTYESVESTIGRANSQANRDFIKNLKKVNNKFKISSGIQEGNIGFVEIENGEAPYQIESTNFSLSDVWSTFISIPNLSCGNHKVKVTDSEGKVLEDDFFITLEDEIFVTQCSDEEFVLPLLGCTNVDAPCISLAINDGTPVILTENQLSDPMMFSEDSRLLYTLADLNGNIISQYAINIDIVNRGDSCDDGNNCTVGVINDNCECVSSPNQELVIVAEPKNINTYCLDGVMLLSTSTEFEVYEWYFSDPLTGQQTYLSNERNVEVSESGIYRVFVETDNDCISEKEFYLLERHSENKGFIEAIPDNSICENEEITLQISGSYFDYNWYKLENGDRIALGSDIVQNASETGLYEVTFRDAYCNYSAKINVETETGDYYLSPENTNLCATSSLNIEGDIDKIASIKWYKDDVLIDGETTNNIEVNDEGIFKTEITLKDGSCTFLLEKDVRLLSDADIDRILIDNGFVKEIIEVSNYPSAKSNGNLPLRMTGNVNVDVTQPGDVIIIIDGNEIPLKEYLELLILEATCESAIPIEGVVLDDFCETITIEDFLKNTANYELRAFIIKSSISEEYFLYRKSKNPPHPRCYDERSYFGGPQLFNWVINKLLCAREFGDEVVLDKYASYSIWLGDNNKLIDNRNYSTIHSLGGGILINNYKKDRILSVPSKNDGEDWEFLIKDKLTVICDLNTGKETGEYYELRIPYVGDGARECLTITVLNEESEFLLNLLDGEDIKNEFATRIVEILNADEFDSDEFEDFPECFFSCDLTCELLQNQLLNKEHKQAVINLLSTSNPVKAKCLIECFDQNELVFPYYSEVFKFWAGRIPYLANLNRLYYLNFKSNYVESDEYFRLEGSRYFFFGSHYTTNLFSNYSINLKSEYNFGLNAIIPKSIWVHEYFKNYPIRLDNHFDFLKVVDKKNRLLVPSGTWGETRGLIEVPGIYMPYAIAKRNENELYEDVTNSINIATTIVGFGALSAAVRAKNLLSFTGFFGGADVTIGMAHIFLDESSFCDELSPKAQEWCQFYKDKVLIWADIILLGGTYAASRVDNLIELQSKYKNLDLDIQEEYLAAARNKYGDDAIDDLKIFLNNPPCLFCLIERKLGTEIVEAFGEDKLKILVDNILKEKANKLVDLSESIKALDDSGTINAVKFLEDIQATALKVGEIGYELERVTPGMVDGWKSLFSKQAWRTNTDYLTKVNRYADDGLEFFEDAGEIYVKQADGVIVGKLDPNDVYDPGQMKVLGESSGRHFDPDLSGGPIVKKSWANPTINQSGIDDVSTHVARFTDPEAIANNNFMISRLDEIKNGQRVPDDFDKRFYTHEIEEYSRFENLGVGSGPHTEANYLNSHTASLEAYSINENVTKIYPSEVPFPQYAGY